MPRTRLVACSLSGLLAGCASTPETVARLDEIHVRPETEGEPVRYQTEVTDRSWLQALQRELFDETDSLEVSKEEVDDPVEFCLDQLLDLLDVDPEDLEPQVLAYAIVVTARVAREDPTQVVRAQALRVLQHLAAGDKGLVQQVEPIDEEEVKRTLIPLLAVARDGPLVAKASLAGFEEAVRVGTALNPGRVSLTEKLSRVALLAAAQLADLEDPGLLAAAQVMAIRQALRAAFLSAAEVVSDRTHEVQVESARLLIELDPRAASEVLRGYYLEARVVSPLVKIVVLRTFADRGVDPRSLDPEFRRILLDELDYPDASVNHWAHICLARLLELDPDEVEDADVRAGWLALGDWEATTERREEG